METFQFQAIANKLSNQCTEKLPLRELEVGPALTLGCASGGLQALETDSGPLCSRGDCPSPGHPRPRAAAFI